MDSKDAPESLEEGGGGGGGARCRCSSARRTATMLLIQVLFTAAGVAISLNIFFYQKSGSSTAQVSEDRGVYLNMINPDRLSFEITWNRSVYLEGVNQLRLQCAGPYMVYLWACVRIYEPGAVVNITIQQGKQSFRLQVDNGCKEAQNVLMLSDKSKVTVEAKHDKDKLEIEHLSLGLHYMLGNQCFPHPSTEEKADP